MERPYSYCIEMDGSATCRAFLTPWAAVTPQGLPAGGEGPSQCLRALAKLKQAVVYFCW